MIDQFDRISNSLRRISADMDAAEAHGLLCGLLCKNSDDRTRWVDQVVSGADNQNVLIREAKEALLDLYETTLDQLEGETFELRLLLRKDEDPIVDRIDDLIHWCHGFLTGLAQAGVKDFKKLPESAQEVIEDLSEITRVGYEPSDDEDENEHAYAEIVEYIRVGVMLVFAELRLGEGDAAPTLH